MILIKLGGSVITNKKIYKVFREDIVKRLAEEIKESKQEIIITHGAGSFGHILAEAFELNSGFDKNFQLKKNLKNETKEIIKKLHLKNQTSALSVVQKDVKELNMKILNTLIENGISAVSLPPSSFVEFESEFEKNEKGEKILKQKIIKPNFEILKKYIELKQTPILFGDVVIDRKIGFTICSADDLMVEIAKEFLPKLTIFVIDEDGIYENFGKKSQKFMEKIDKNFLIKLKNDYEKAKKEHKEKVADVTGGIIKKIESALKTAKYSRTLIISANIENRLRDVLVGKKVAGTEIV